MSEQLQDTIGDSVVTTTLMPQGWITLVKGGALDGFNAAMVATADPAVLHAGVIEEVEKANAGNSGA